MSRYKESRKGSQPLPWAKSTIFGAGKILSGLAAHAYYDKYGSLEDWFSKYRENLLTQLVCDTFPFFRKAFDEENKSVTSIGHKLATRGEFCLPQEKSKNGNNELDRFVQPDFVSIMEIIRTAHKESKVVHLDELLWAQEEQIILRHPTGKPSVYIRTYPGDLHIYVGTTENLAKRDHKNSNLRLSCSLAVTDNVVAKSLEDAIHTRLKELGCFSKTGKGLFETPFNDPQEEVLKYVNSHQKLILRNTVVIRAIEPKET